MITRRGFLGMLLAAPAAAVAVLNAPVVEPGYSFLVDLNHFNYTQIFRTPFGFTGRDGYVWFSRSDKGHVCYQRDGRCGRRARWAA